MVVPPWRPDVEGPNEQSEGPRGSSATPPPLFPTVVTVTSRDEATTDGYCDKRHAHLCFGR